MTVYEGYKPVIGLEVHAQLTTDSKMFCGCKVSYGESPNSRTCPVCLGLPGALPVLNKKAVEYALQMILAVGGEVALHSVFARKNYFYPDLPKGYQISQYSQPIGRGGKIKYFLENGHTKTCRLNRIHLEEDAGKSLHPSSKERYTRLDFNRCGVPLLEIVSEPDLKTPEEAYGYLNKLKQILQYLEICSADMEKGHLRCDANVSVLQKGKKKLSVRTEVKNLNSFKGVKRALKYEIARQIKILKAGGTVKPVTLWWDENRQTVRLLRTKETSEDYRYFPEPDLRSLTVDTTWLDRIRHSLTELPDHKYSRLVKQYKIRPYDARIMVADRPLADYFENVIACYNNSRAVVNWITTEILAILDESKGTIADFRISPAMLAELLKSIDDGIISGRTARQVLREMAVTGNSAVRIITSWGLKQITDKKVLQKEVDKVITANPNQVEKYLSGKTALLDFFIGEVMKSTRGRANPELVGDLLIKMLKK